MYATRILRVHCVECVRSTWSLSSRMMHYERLSTKPHYLDATHTHTNLLSDVFLIFVFLLLCKKEWRPKRWWFHLHWSTNKLHWTTGSRSSLMFIIFKPDNQHISKLCHIHNACAGCIATGPFEFISFICAVYAGPRRDDDDRQPHKSQVYSLTNLSFYKDTKPENEIDFFVYHMLHTHSVHDFSNGLEIKRTAYHTPYIIHYISKQIDTYWLAQKLSKLFVSFVAHTHTHTI